MLKLASLVTAMGLLAMPLGHAQIHHGMAPSTYIQGAQRSIKALSNDQIGSLQAAGQGIGLSLAALFATGQASKHAVHLSVDKIASIQSQLRFTHLKSHLAITDELSPPQRQRYAELRRDVSNTVTEAKKPASLDPRVAQHHGGGSGHGGHDMIKTAAPTNAKEAFEAANAKMHKDMTITLSGNPDLDFARSMIPHHQGAIDMARIVLQYGKDPELKKLADEIIKAQDTEIALMKAWIAKNAK